ncbi:hypothetical protein OQA88_12460 [Cercophora sp. LCS_1]
MATTPQPTLTSLAKTILQHAETLEAYLIANAFPQPSFLPTGPTDFPIPPSNTALHATRHALIDATNTLRTLITYPRDLFKWITLTDHTLTAALAVISHFHLAQSVPLSAPSPSPISPRFIRRAALSHIFIESPPAHVSHTAASRLLATDPQLQALVAHMTEEAFPASAKLVDALENCGDGGEPSESPFTLAFGQSFFERKMAKPETLERFGNAMSAWSAGDGSGFIRDGYAWGELKEGARVVDVGGAGGHISLAVAERFTGLRFVVEDLEGLRGQAEALAAQAGEDVRKRVRFVGCDFFGEQPEEARGAEVYLLRYILHDWSDGYAVRILKRVVEAMSKDSRIVIADAVMPPAGVLAACQEEVLRSFDVSMLAQLNAQERTLEMWEKLVADASDGRLGIAKVIMPEKGESVSILEVRFK